MPAFDGKSLMTWLEEALDARGHGTNDCTVTVELESVDERRVVDQLRAVLAVQPALGIVEGCRMLEPLGPLGTAEFVLRRVPRHDTAEGWWREPPDDTVLHDPLEAKKPKEVLAELTDPDLSPAEAWRLLQKLRREP